MLLGSRQSLPTPCSFGHGISNRAVAFGCAPQLAGATARPERCRQVAVEAKGGRGGSKGKGKGKGRRSRSWAHIGAPRRSTAVNQLVENAAPVIDLNAMKEMMLLTEPAAALKAKRMGLAGGMMLLDGRVPPFHEEYAQEGRWPSEMNVSDCKKVLQSAYEMSRGAPVHEAMLAMPSEIGVQPEDLAKRLGVMPPDLATLEWLLGPTPMGAVRFKPRRAYGAHVFHSFSNAPVRAEVLTPGTTHVAIGFLDLGGLAAAMQLMEAGGDMAGAGAGLRKAEGAAGSALPGSGSASSTSTSPGPLRWVGYDASPYAVAKTLVLREMLLQGAPTDHVMQVWYSAAWTQDAHASFTSALLSALNKGQDTAASTGGDEQGERHALVRQLLSHWAKARTVPLRKARAGWLKTITRSNFHIANFKGNADRMALCHYLLTGELPLPAGSPAASELSPTGSASGSGEEPELGTQQAAGAMGGGVGGMAAVEVGSTLMFEVPREFGTQAEDEHFLQTIPSHELFSRRLDGDVPDIVAAGVAILSARICTLGRALREGRVTVEVRLGEVGPHVPDTVAAIASLRPWTVSWSNVPDYIGPTPEAFHKLARAVSRPGGVDTVHFMHSMNWIRDVKGAFSMDYQMTVRDDKRDKFMGRMLDSGKQAISAGLVFQGLGDLILCPPIDNARNICDYVTVKATYQAWVDAFFQTAGMIEPSRQVVEPPMYSTLSRANSTLAITFTYDPDIALVAPLGMNEATTAVTAAVAGFGQVVGKMLWRG